MELETRISKEIICVGRRVVLIFRGPYGIQVTVTKQTRLVVVEKRSKWLAFDVFNL